MRSPFKIFQQTLALAALLSLFGSAFLFTHARASDRFIVPSSPSENNSPPSPPPAPPPPPPPPPSSSGNDNSYTPPPSDSSRFNVPVPNNPSPDSNYRPGRPRPGGGSIGGHGHGYGGYGHFPYWGGSYYWAGDYYYWGGQRYISEVGLFGGYTIAPGFTLLESDPRSANENNIPIFFPPNPPPIGAPVPPKQSPGARTPAPAELAKFVYEPFYAPLSTRLSEQDLTKKLIARLDTYKARRSALQTELQNKLDALKANTPTDRIQQLEAFAREQTPRIAELEKTAEQLRSDLLRGGLVGIFSGTGDWNQSRGWTLNGNTNPLARAQTLPYEFLVMRAAVYYQDGLSPAQRRLLREVAMELQIEAFKPKNAEPPKDDSTYVFFSPETARIRVSDDLPADLSVKIAAYQSEKSAIKTELRDTLYLQDRSPAARRVQTLKQLAENQAPRLAALEGLADDIRASLSRLPKPPGPTQAPAFPAELAARISAYQKEKLAIQKLIQAKLDEIRARLSLTPEALSLTRKTNEDKTRNFHLETAAGLPDDKTAVIRKAMQDLNKQNEQRFTNLSKERDAIRDEVARFAAAHPDTSSENTVRSLLRNFYAALREEESWQPYHDYKIAVYQPGLSPEQRRLLFEVALEKLALPLPEGEFQQ